MPIYEYRCDRCGFQKEFLQKMSDPALTACPECGEDALKKMISAAGFQLKGNGWYATDFKGGKADKGESKPSPTPACGAGACSACTGT
jgi:putative FmdB family regulatory protein